MNQNTKYSTVIVFYIKPCTVHQLKWSHRKAYRHILYAIENNILLGEEGTLHELVSVRHERANFTVITVRIERRHEIDIHILTKEEKA